ncbi:recombinase family protein [Alteromonas stellipolaris]|uniref:recombinase family protein n=1 Tax=Alteromonas stellipolaris TaxID=233316 RepID=UPI0026E3DB8A|nr:recombinase family protein [Alteromonas stellipolaris]MDO6533851.1 recombinase family protein [Alteromonas stellipolaris]MDO6626255.1 recombinase family protein [Alteromonas stellipolaris]
MKTKQPRIVGYLRVSTERQAKENHSLADQEESIKQWAEEHDAELLDMFVDEGRSGYKGQRPAFEKMLMEIQTGQLIVDYVVAYSQSRIARNERERHMAVHILEQVGARFVSIMEPSPEDRDMDFMLSTVQGAMFEMQSRQQSKLASTKLNKYAKLGYHTGGIAPFGYKSTEILDPVDNRKRKILTLNEEEAEVVQLIFNLSLSGTSGRRMGTKAIATHMNESCIKKRGKVWSFNDIHKILTNTIYYGERLYGKKRKNSRDNSSPTIQKVPSIINKSVFDEVQEELKLNAPQKNNHQALISTALLTGLAKCGICGSNMVINTGKSGRYKYYKCRNRIKCSVKSCDMRQIPKEQLEKAVLTEIKDKLLNNMTMNALLEDIKHAVKDKFSEYEIKLFELNSKKGKIESKCQRLIDLVGSGELVPSELVNKNITQHQSDVYRLENKIKEYKNFLKVPIKKFGPKKVAIFLEAARKVLLQPDSNICKSLLLNLIDKITVHSGSVLISGRKFKAMGIISSYETGHSFFKVPSHMSIWRRGRDSNPRKV